MLEYYYRQPHVQARIKANVLYKQIRKLIYYFRDCGYQTGTIKMYIPKVEHFGIWLEDNGIKVSSVNKDTVSSFLNEHLPNCHCTPPCSRNRKYVRAALNCLLCILGSQNQKSQKTDITPVEKEIDKFKAYLSDVCGLSISTIRFQIRYTKGFLLDIFGKQQIKHRDINPHQIMKYVSQKAKQYKLNSLQNLIYSLRCYFRFLQLEGKCSHNLIDAVPTVPSWKLATIPKTMTKEQLSRFLASFNRKTPSGQRDYAMALCLSELGLRASEVKDLLLDDIDWKNSTVTIRASKTLRSRILPLPVCLGRALACYLKNGRPKTDSRNIFIRHRAPKDKPVTFDIVSGVMCRAYKRASLENQISGTHIFRHTLATVIHQKGATLKEVADILGHKCIDTTTIYTKVNLPMLAKVALPWPEVRS
jgi:integrase/recombinase XerD